MQTRAVFCLTHKFCLNSELVPTLKFLNMPGGTTGKEPTCQCRRHKRHRFSPGVGEIPWRRAWQPTPVFLPGEFHGQRSLEGYSPQGCKESDRTEGSTHTPSKFQVVGLSDNTKLAFSHASSRLELPVYTLNKAHLAPQSQDSYFLPLSPGCVWAVVPAKGNESPWKLLRKLKKTPAGELRG